MDGREPQPREALLVQELLRDDGVRECARLDLAPRGSPSRPGGRLQQVQGRLHDPRRGRALGQGLRLRRQGGRAFQALMKRVFSSHNQILLHHFRNLLEAAGIETEVRRLSLSSAMGELPPGECQAELWVAEEDFPEAEKALKVRITGPDWTCRCGETSGAQFTHCWKCGAACASL